MSNLEERSMPKQPNAAKQPLSVVRTMIAECMCGTYHMKKGFGSNQAHTQFIQLRGIRFIGLGAVMDELSPRERVYDTLEVFRSKTAERLVTVGYLTRKDLPFCKVEAEAVPLDAWLQDYPDYKNLTSASKKIVGIVRDKKYKELVELLAKQMHVQKSHVNRDDNLFLLGITAHNLGVANVLLGLDTEAESFFREAIRFKEESFGKFHPEVALSWDELGILLFARSDFDGASSAFRTAHQLRQNFDIQEGEVPHPILAMTLNNIACCDFQLGKHQAALDALEEARSIQHKAVGSTVQGDLDLLHVAIVYCNCGYLMLALKRYEEARSILEEALLIQESVLEDGHRAIRDTRSNLEFTNAFHS